MPAVLDNLDEIRRIDKSDMLSFCINAPRHYMEAAEKARKSELDYPKPKMIIVAGMGASAMGGEFVRDWGRTVLTVPVEVCREYTLPAHAKDGAITFMVSYSGETEETLSCLLDAAKKGCKIFCISSDGTLLKIAEKMRVPALQIPKGIPPRAALPYLLMPLMVFMEKLGLVPNIWDEILEAKSVLEQICIENSPERRLEINPSKKLAVKVNGTIPIIYGFGFYRSVAQRLKQQFNENSKIPAFWNAFPELNHNEVVGWERAEGLAKYFSALFIRDKDEPLEVRARIEATKQILNSKGVNVQEIWRLGKGRLSKMVSATLIGDFASVYLAILRGVDPTPVETISWIKGEVAKTGVKEEIIKKLESLADDFRIDFGQ
ncbi:MAG: bifunctional phosphoglucose/phosphomannose isomerase [Candidatus Bathyarchaeia archaeon]